MRRVLAVPVATLLAASCGTGAGDAANPSPILTVRDSFDGGMAALASGRLSIRGGCVFLEYDGQTKAVVWPTGTVLSTTDDTLVLADGRALPNGVDLEVGGGSVTYAEALTFASGASSAAKACAEAADADTVFVADSDPSAIGLP